MEQGIQDEPDLRPVVEELREENRKLRERLDQLARRRTKAAGFAIGLASRVLLGRDLASSIKRWIQAKSLSNPLPLDETSDTIAAVIRRLIRVGLVGFLVAVLPIALLAWQNRLIGIQISQQAADARIARRAELIDTIYSMECPTLAGDETEIQDAPLIPLQPEAGCRPRAHVRARTEAALALIEIERNQAKTPDLGFAVLGGSDFIGEDLSNVALVNAVLRSSLLANADFRGAFLPGADLRYSLLFEADLTEANLSGAKLSWANLKRTNFTRTNLNGADLRHADLRRSLGLSQEQVDLACCDNRTLLPQGLKLPALRPLGQGIEASDPCAMLLMMAGEAQPRRETEEHPDVVDGQ